MASPGDNSNAHSSFEDPHPIVVGEHERRDRHKISAFVPFPSRGLPSPLRLVPGVGIEPTRLSSVDFESTASANSATRATVRARKLGRRRVVSMQFSGPASAELHEPGDPSTSPGGLVDVFERNAADLVYLPVSYPFFLVNS